MSQLIIFNKPFRVLCQFRKNDDRLTLADFIQMPDVNVAGRLDFDSEGLLLLTDDGVLGHQLTHPKFHKEKTYWVQVEGAVTKNAIQQLSEGVMLKDGLTRPAKVKLMDEPSIWERHPPIRERRQIPTSWLEITISEGKNRQVRRMTAHVGYPTLRLIRWSIGDWNLENLKPGEYRAIQVKTPTQKPKKTGSKSRSAVGPEPFKRSSDRSQHRNQSHRSRSRKD